MIINKGLNDEMVLLCYKINKRKLMLVQTFYFLTFGILKLIFDWLPSVKLKCSSSKCKAKDADYVLLKDIYDQKYVEKLIRLNYSSMDQYSDYKKNDISTVHWVEGSGPQLETSTENCYLVQPIKILFINNRIRYIYDEKKNNFEKLVNPFENKSCQYFYDSVGLTFLEVNERRNLYGENSVKVHVTPILKLLYTQGLNPFYIFQIFSCTLWYMDQYYYFATCIIFISIISIIVQIKETREIERALKNTIGFSDTCFVYRRDIESYIEIACEYLVPGDLIKIPKNGCKMQCDAVLIKGTCIVDESMLTGESIPITKTPIINPKYLDQVQEPIFNDKEHSKHILFSGTSILQTRCSVDVNAVVLQTGFATSKGELVRSILYPKPVNFHFTQDSFKFIACMVFIAIFGMIYTLIIMIIRKEPTLKIIVRTLDLLTIVIPPALPAAMTVGIIFAQKRLKKKLIYCINPGSINVSGVIDCFCFDKTGTLTEDGLDLKAVVPSLANKFCSEITKHDLLSCNQHVISAMATCHCLTIIDGKLVGDPLDLILFEATNWILDSNELQIFHHDALTIIKPRNHSMHENNDGYYLLQQFSFTSLLQRSSVIVKPMNSFDYIAYVKGSPKKKKVPTATLR